MIKYVLITAAHNEEAFIAKTCESVIAQSVQPLRWIVVDDASNDGTANIVARYRDAHPGLIELLQVERPPGRDFRHKVQAFNLGMVRARELGFTHIGNLDADISFSPDYYARMLSHFNADPDLGIAGGMVDSCIDGKFVSQKVAPDSVAGAVQLFRKACFEDVGGYLPLRQGGIDAAAEIIARKSGWTVRTFAGSGVHEHRRTGSASCNPLSARVREGRRLYSLGYGLPFFTARCLRRSVERPRITGSIAALYGYLASAFRGDPLVLPPEVIAYLRGEQRKKILQLFRFDRVA